jgi:ribonuclease P protein 3
LQNRLHKFFPELDGITLNFFSGVCKACRKSLNPINITKEEFRALQFAFMDKVVVGADIFRKTTPEEINEFKNFVKMTAPYDMVIDGLNIAFTGGPKKAQSHQSLARTVSILTMICLNLYYIYRGHLLIKTWNFKRYCYFIIVTLIYVWD